jgi:uncharacterized protein DUF1570
MSRILLTLISLLLASAALLPLPARYLSVSAFATAPGQAVESPFEAASKLLEGGDAKAALVAATTALASHPFDVDGYLLMVKISQAMDNPEGTLRWAKWAYWSYKYSGQSKKLEQLLPLFADQWEGWNKDELILENWEKSLSEAAKKASSKKQYRLAGYFMNKLLALNPDDKKLVKDYDKLAKKAGQQLSGGSFVADSIRRKSPKWIAKENKKHEHWEEPFERQTRHYDLYTNVSWEFAETAASAMDQVNEFYREVFRYKKKARAKIHVMRKRSDFDKMALKILGRPQESLSIGGYWVAGLRTLVAYDRSYNDLGRGRDDLWNTMFHEASHQFMTLLSKGRQNAPAWLNEGTACYFEGCQIKSDGTIVKNAPALQRLRSWHYIENSNNRHSLEELIAHPRNIEPANGSWSYEGHFYPYGWALVYFLLNYEENDRRVYGVAVTDDGKIRADYKAVRKAGRLVYRDAYNKYLKYFTENGSGGDQFHALEMAKKFFVDEIKDPDVPDWEAFESRWRKFTTSLYLEDQSGQDIADVYQARARGYLLAKDFERARMAAEMADDKRPLDPETFRLLALANVGEGQSAEAVYWMVRHWEYVWPEGRQQETQEALAWLQDNGGKDVMKLYLNPTMLAFDQLEAACSEALAADQPIAAVLFAQHGTEVIGMDHQAMLRHMGLATAEDGEKTALEIAGEDLRMWQRAFEKGPDSNRKFLAPGVVVDIVRYDQDGVFLFDPEGEGFVGNERVGRRSLEFLHPPYEIRGSVMVDGGTAVLNLGLDRSGRSRSSMLFHIENDNALVSMSKVGRQVDHEAGTAAMVHSVVQQLRVDQPDGKFHFELVAKDGEGSYFTCNGSQHIPIPEAIPSSRMTGPMALATFDNTAVLWQDLEIRPSRPFWPVR